LANTGFSATSRAAAGIYNLTLAAPPPAGKAVVTVTTNGNSGVALGNASVVGAVVTVVTYGASGFGSNTPGDTDFFVTVSQGA
jgi:hypothetical protein